MLLILSLGFNFFIKSYFFRFFHVRSVVAVAFQSTFRAEMHQNDVFLFFKKLILTSAL